MHDNKIVCSRSSSQGWAPVVTCPGRPISCPRDQFQIRPDGHLSDESDGSTRARTKGAGPVRSPCWTRPIRFTFPPRGIPVNSLESIVILHHKRQESFVSERNKRKTERLRNVFKTYFPAMFFLNVCVFIFTNDIFQIIGLGNS